MSVNVDEMDDDQIEAAQAAEDEAAGNLEVNGNTPDPESEAPAAVAAETAETVAEIPPEPEAPKVAGVASKDGTRVLPYAALQAERRAARHERTARERAEQEAASLRQQIEDLKAGKTPAKESTNELSEEELAALADNFPEAAKVVNQVKDLQAKVAKLTPAKAEPEAKTEAPADDPIQEAIDAVPLLLDWQTSDPEKFARATAIDEVMKTSPKWRNKPLHERFEHVAKQVADEFDIPFTETPRATTPNKDTATTKVSAAARTVPSTLSDFKGGAVDQADIRVDKLPPARAMARMSAMTDEEIDRHLSKFG